MAKYSYRVVKNDKSWTAEIVRRKTAKESVVTRKKDGFVAEDTAKEWGEAELKSFVTDLNARKRRAKLDGK